MKQEIENVAEEVDRVVEDIQYAVKNPWAVPVAAGVGLVVGLGIGFLLGRRTIKEVTVIEEIHESDISQDSVEQIAKDYMAFKARKQASEEARRREAQAIRAAVVQEQRNDPADILVDEEAILDIQHTEHIVIAGGDLVLDTTSVFAAKSIEPWDYEEELKHRTEEKPYVIHKDEFWAEEKEYDQTSLCYYAGDDILTDQEDAPIYNYQSIIGHELRFGAGSLDPNVFHVRNDQRQCEYEIVRDPGKYTESVLGVVAEAEAEDEDLRHSHEPRKFKKKE